MTSLQLLQAVGNIPDRYILEAHQARPRRARWWLLAAGLAAALLLTGCAIALHWYGAYFAAEQGGPLSKGQQDYIQSQVQDIQQVQCQDGCCVELKSVLAAGKTAYVTLGITAPETVDFSPALLSEPKAHIRLWKLWAVSPEGYGDIAYEAAEDGDGLANTVNLVLRLDMPEDPADAGAQQWEIHFSGIRYVPHAPAGEEAAPEITLAAGNWQFPLEIPADTGQIQLLSQPIWTKALVIRSEEPVAPPEIVVEQVQLTAIRLTPLGAEIQFVKPQPLDTFESMFIEPEAPGGEEAYVLTKDGVKIHFFQGEGAKEQAWLKADSPIPLNDVTKLVLPDGTVVERSP